MCIRDRRNKNSLEEVPEVLLEVLEVAPVVLEVLLELPSVFKGLQGLSRSGGDPPKSDKSQKLTQNGLVQLWDPQSRIRHEILHIILLMLAGF